MFISSCIYPAFQAQEQLPPLIQMLLAIGASFLYLSILYIPAVLRHRLGHPYADPCNEGKRSRRGHNNERLVQVYRHRLVVI